MEAVSNCDQITKEIAVRLGIDNKEFRQECVSPRG
jgi:hypothetical protein